MANNIPGEGNQSKADLILAEIQSTPDLKRASNPQWYLRNAEELAMALGGGKDFKGEEDLLTEMRSEVAQMKLDYMRKQEKRNISEAHLWIEAQPKFADLKKQEAKVDRIKEIIRIYKHTAESLTRGF